jgi:hypothetical protein
MTEATVDIQDLITAAIQKQPANFKDAFNSVIADRVYSAIESRKLEISKNVVNQQPASEEQPDDTSVEAETGEQNGEDAQTN